METTILKCLNYHKSAQQLFMELYDIGNVYLIGGVLREFLEAGNIKNTKDIDVVIDTKEIDEFNAVCKKHHAKKNSFDGYKINCDDTSIDVWRIEQTWAYRENIISCSKKDYLKNLPFTVFFNLDSLVYDIKRNEWYDELYRKAKESNVLDIVLEENPYINLNILRGLIFQKKYHMKYSIRLKELVRNRYKQEKEYEKILYDIQFKRYKKEILSLNYIKNQLDCIFLEK